MSKSQGFENAVTMLDDIPARLPHQGFPQFGWKPDRQKTDKHR